MTANGNRLVKGERTAPAVITESEGLDTIVEMESLLSVDISNLSGHKIPMNTSVEYNPQSQRIEVTFASKPSETVRDALKSMHFGWNKFEGCWELYTWQARLFDREGLSLFLSALNSGVLVQIPEVPSEAKRKWWKEIRDAPRKLVEALAKATDAERSSVDVARCLRYFSSFKKYSANNRLHILLQCPDATLIAGERKWNELGRYVKWGEQAITILGPRMRYIYVTDPQTGKRIKTDEKELAGFLALPVYDVSQTYGEPLPDVEYPDMSGGDAQVFLDAMKEFCKDNSIEVFFTDLSKLGIEGFASYEEIGVSTANSVNLQCSVIIHEVAHKYLHKHSRVQKGASRPKHLRETEAEGVAYVVSQYLGLKIHAPTYLALQGVKSTDVLSCMKNITKVSDVIISYLVQKTNWNQIPIL